MSTRAFEDSYVTPAKRQHPCKLCLVTIEKGESRLVYAQGKRSWLSMHIRCAQKSGSYSCSALQQQSEESR